MPGKLAAVVMAGGLGTRMRSEVPKHFHPLLGRRMVDWVIRAAQDAGVSRVVVVASPDTAALFDGLEVAVQQTPLGTGDAVRAARGALEGATGDVLVLNGDVPALTAGLVRALGAFRADVSGAGPTVYGLFHHQRTARSAERALKRLGRTWITAPAWYG